MRRLFFRVWASLGLVLVIFILVLIGLAPRPDSMSLEHKVETLLATSPQTVIERLGGTLTPDELEIERTRLEQELGHPVNLLPDAAVAATVGTAAQRLLAQGEMVVQLHELGAVIYLALPEQGFVAVLRPSLPTSAFTGNRAFFLLAFVVLGIITAVYFMVRPLEKQLEELSTAAKRFGEGSFDARSRVRRKDALGQLATSFNEMAARVQNMVEGRQALLRGVSHELRTPLSRLKFALELLEIGSIEQRHDLIEHANEDIDELEELIKELMTYTKLEGPEPALAMEPTDLAPLLTEMVADARRLRQDIRIDLECNTLPELTVNARMVQRSLVNLVNNAARYAGSHVRVRARDTGHAVEVRVEDDGPGVPLNDRERVFEPFVRLDSARSRDTGGVGLGLAIARRIAAAHGGRIYIEDSALGGAAFVWTIPA